MESIKDEAIVLVLQALEAADLARVASTSKRLHKLATSDSVWKSVFEQDFGDLEYVKAVLEQAGISVSFRPSYLDAGNLDAKLAEQSVWKARYRFAKGRTIGDEEERNAKDNFDRAKELMNVFKETTDAAKLTEACELVLQILDMFPAHVESYYFLGFVCFVLNRLEQSEQLLALAKTADPSYSPVDDLADEIERLQIGIYGDEDEVALLTEDQELSAPLNKILEEIFQSFDVDGDQLLSIKELEAFVMKTNGAKPPKGALDMLLSRFESTKVASDLGGGKGLKLQGFKDYYLHQTLDDPEETRGDIEKHGYDGSRLRKIVEEIPLQA